MTHMESNPNWLDRSLYPFPNRFANIDGNTIHYIDEGSGPILLLLHGNPTWSFLYRRIVRTLSSHFRCIALDYPGFGLSTPKPGYAFLPREHSSVVERFVDHLGLKDLSIMVQDWGGPIGLGFAGRRPELIRSVILGNTFAWPAQRSKGMSAFSKIVGSELSKLLITRYNALARWLIPAGINRKLTEQELAAYMGPFRTVSSRLPMWIFAHQVLASGEYLAQVEAGLSTLREKPALVVGGVADGAFRTPDRLRLLQHFPNHRVCLLPGAKHFIQENAPDGICAAILEWGLYLQLGYFGTKLASIRKRVRHPLLRHKHPAPDHAPTKNPFRFPLNRIVATPKSVVVNPRYPPGRSHTQVAHPMIFHAPPLTTYEECRAHINRRNALRPPPHENASASSKTLASPPISK